MTDSGTNEPPWSSMTHKILFVDDESVVIDGIRRMMHRDFEIDIAYGGAEALTALRKEGPYAVVVSDMRMPGMTGAQLLAEIRRQAPDTVRMLLTGYTDLEAAMDAFNHSNIFRFLTKPCDKEILTVALTAGLAQYDLICSERELLEKTLMGSIKVLADVLAAASPEAFGRSMRIASWVRHIATSLVVPEAWQLDAAATLSQLGCITLYNELLQRAYEGAELTPEEQTRYEAHPQFAMSLLEHIPRLGPVAWIIGQQFVDEIPTVPPQFVPKIPESAVHELVRAATILKLAVAFEELTQKTIPFCDAMSRLRERSAEFPNELIEALSTLRPVSIRTLPRLVPIAKLAPGMVLDQEIRTHVGMLIVGKGQEVTRVMLAKLENFLQAGMIDKEIMALLPA